MSDDKLIYHTVGGDALWADEIAALSVRQSAATSMLPVTITRHEGPMNEHGALLWSAP